jgi:uncharacterized membrane protein
MAAQTSKQEIVQSDSHSIVRGEYFEGPFPPPEILAQYEELQPGLVDRIFRYAETEQAQRHRIQAKQTDTDGFDVRSHFWAHCLTSICVTTMYLALLAAGSYALYLGHIKTALAILASPVVRVMLAMKQMFRKGRSQVADKQS